MHLDGTKYSNQVLSNNNFTIRTTGKRYTHTQHKIRIRLYVPEQYILDVTVRANEYLPDPDVRVSHNVSTQPPGKWILENKLTNIVANNNQQAITQEVTDTKNDNTVQKETENQSEDMNDVTPLSPDFSNLTTDVGVFHIYDAPPPTVSPPIQPKITAYSCRI